MFALWSKNTRMILITTWALLILFALACGKKKEQAGEEETPLPQAEKSEVVQAYGKLPLSFTENRGQVAEPVRFYIRGSRGTVYYTPEEVVYDVVESTEQRRERGPLGERPEMAMPDTTVRRRGVVVRMRFQGANPAVVLEGIDQLEGKVNIFRGKDPSKWKTGICTFGGIIYRDLYPGIDLTYFGQEGQLSQKLTVRPGAKVEQIVFRYEGAEKIRVDETGDLRIETALGTITEPNPSCYQRRDDDTMEVKGRYRLLDEHTVGFEVKRYDRALPLIISRG